MTNASILVYTREQRPLTVINAYQKNMTKLFKPYVSWKAIFYTVRTLLSSQLAEGPMVKKFEKEFGEKFGKKNVVALNSGTTALELAYLLAGIGKGDEVITPVLTCTATNLPLVRLDAKIVFADIDYDLNINIEDVKKKITKKTKAIVFVHFGGNNRGLAELLTICRKRGIVLIEDAAQAVGSGFWGKADYTAVSLQAIKTLTSGDGGFLICKSKEDYTRAKKLRWFGYDREEKQKKGDTDLVEAGFKWHLCDVLASVGLGNLQELNKVLSHNDKIRKIYKSYGLFCHSWLAGGLFGNRDELYKILKENNIESGMHHFRNDKYTVFGGRRLNLPVMNEVEGAYLFVPFHHGITTKMAHKIGGIIRKYATQR